MNLPKIFKLSKKPHRPKLRELAQEILNSLIAFRLFFEGSLAVILGDIRNLRNQISDTHDDVEQILKELQEIKGYVKPKMAARLNVTALGPVKR